MIAHSIRKATVLAVALVLLASLAFSETRYDRDLVVTDETRSMKVEKVFKELMAAYEDEDPQRFLALVSDDRFRQDYITFTDALYSDFRTYEIHQVDYWIDRVVSDHVKQFLFVKWEKRYETLANGRQITQSGYSRFLFDEVNGAYLLVELAGNPLFGGSLKEWQDEMPPISGQVIAPKAKPQDPVPPVDPNTGNGGTPSLIVCTGANLMECGAQSDCEGAGGYWYNGQCNAAPQTQCDTSHLFLCDSGNCESAGGYWYNNTCNSQPAGLPDLAVGTVTFETHGSSSTFHVTILNNGPVASAPCRMQILAAGSPIATEDLSAIPAHGSITRDLIGSIEVPGAYPTIFVDSDQSLDESDETNNTKDIPW